MAEKWRKLLEEGAKANEQMWKGQTPSCCSKKEESNEEEARKA